MCISDRCLPHRRNSSGPLHFNGHSLYLYLEAGKLIALFMYKLICCSTFSAIKTIPPNSRICINNSNFC